MSLFDQLVDEALRSLPQFAPLRTVVEKELLHHDILREMSHAGFLRNLTFIGGTCLRACYGSQRLSEDLDFTGGADFAKEALADLGKVLLERLEVKYGLPVEVSAPCREEGKGGGDVLDFLSFLGRDGGGRSQGAWGRENPCGRRYYFSLKSDQNSV